MTTPINVHFAQWRLRISTRFSYRSSSVQSEQKSQNQQTTTKIELKIKTAKKPYPTNQQKIAQVNTARNKKNL